MQKVALFRGPDVSVRAWLSLSLIPRWTVQSSGRTEVSTLPAAKGYDSHLIPFCQPLLDGKTAPGIQRSRSPDAATTSHCKRLTYGYGWFPPDSGRDHFREFAAHLDDQLGGFGPLPEVQLTRNIRYPFTIHIDGALPK